MQTGFVVKHTVFSRPSGRLFFLLHSFLLYVIIKATARTGTTPIIFGYNGRDGVVTDANGLLYMRARYYSPTLRRFINADILAGSLDDSTTLNRYAYADGNPVMNVDPLGLMVIRDGAVSYVPKTPLDRKRWADEQKFLASLQRKSQSPSKPSDDWGALDNAWRVAYNYNLGDAVFDLWVSVFKHVTQKGYLDGFLNLSLGATKDEDGIYHIRQDWWQSIHFVGYNDLYDLAFAIGVGATGNTMNRAKFPFSVDGKEYVIWAWKGDYINLGTGAEVGIYEESIIPGHYLTGTEYAMPMALALKNDATGETIFHYTPREKQWWITGFEPSTPNADTENLTMYLLIDFSGQEELYEGFRTTYEYEGSPWSFFAEGKVASLKW